MVSKAQTRKAQSNKSVASREGIRNSLFSLRASFFQNETKEFVSLVRLILFMVVFGLVVVLSASNVNSIIATGNPFVAALVQVAWAFLGLTMMFIISKLTIEQIENYGRIFFIGSFVLQLLVIVPGIGRASGGNTNWIGIGQFGFQPSEFLKLGLIIYLATLIASRIELLDDWKSVGQPVLVVTLLVVGAIFGIGRDLGTSAVILLMVVGIMFLIGLPWRHLAKFFIAMGLIFVIGAALAPSRVLRILNFVSQGAGDPEGLSWQQRHGSWALASGGIFGTGLGGSKLSWGWIPEIENDFIFASIGEEWGFIGALVVLGLFFMLFVKLRRMAQNSSDVFVSVVITGVMLWVTIQALINIAVVLHLFPVLGVPLPLISKGGSSLVAILMALGIVLAFERTRVAVRKKSRR